MGEYIPLTISHASDLVAISVLREDTRCNRGHRNEY
jgi:hypothetical protein